MIVHQPHAVTVREPAVRAALEAFWAGRETVTNATAAALLGRALLELHYGNERITDIGHALLDAFVEAQRAAAPAA